MTSLRKLHPVLSEEKKPHKREAQLQQGFGDTDTEDRDPITLI